MKLKHLSLILAATLALGACGTKKNATAPAEMIPEGRWKITAVNGEALPDSMETQPFLAFNHAEKRVHGNCGCNIVNSTYTQEKPGQLKFGGMMTTMMACPDLAIERRILDALEQVVSFTATGKSYDLCNKDGKAVIHLEK